MRQLTGVFDFGQFIENLFSDILEVGENLSKIFTRDYAKTFWKIDGFYILVLLFFGVIGTSKVMPKNEYTDIEHGSSDWSKNGEQYKILNRSRGIILAEDNYLPLDKRGNTNVLVVGRFRFW